MLRKIKNTKIYYFLLIILFIPLYSFIWEYLINLNGKLIGLLYRFKNYSTKYLNFNGNSKKLILKDKRFEQISDYIKKNLNKKFLEEKILFIQSDDYKKILKNSDNEAHFKNPFVSDVFLEVNEDIQKKIINFATSDFMLKTATKYLGVFPIITRINLSINVPTNKNASSSQLWHRDDFGYKNLDLFLAITDIDETNGPLITLEKPDPLKIFCRIEKEVDTGLKGERGKISDKNFKYLDSENKKFLKLKGPSGTAILIDSIRNYHKGGHCLKNHRVVLRINYSTLDTTYPFEKRKDLVKIYKKLDLEKNYFKNYLFRDKNIFFELLKIPQKLFSFYHLVSIKKK